MAGDRLIRIDPIAAERREQNGQDFKFNVARRFPQTVDVDELF